MLRHLRIALRTLLRQPSFSGIVVVTLALGIGATTAIFTVVNAVVLAPLPYDRAERLVRVEHPVPRLNAEWEWGVSEAGFFALRTGSRLLEDLAVYEERSGVLAGEEVAAPVSIAQVSANVFDVLGAQPAAGRLLRWEDNQPGTSRVVVLSHDFWRNRLGGDPSVVGSTVELNGNPIEVVGITEPGFDLPTGETDLWYPVEISEQNRPVNWHRFAAIGLLREGVSPESAAAELKGLVGSWPSELSAAYGGDFIERSGFTVAVNPLRDEVVGEVRGALWVLLGAVGTVLLIGCVNVANLFLVRLESGRRESALRTALGASRRQLAAKWLSESFLLGAAAAVLGLLLAWWGVGALVAAGPELPRLDEISLGWESGLFTVVVALLTALTFGFLPLLRSGVRFEWLREGRGLTSSRERQAVRRGLVVLEIALALVLLAGAGLMLRTFQNLRAVDPGVETEGVLTLELSLPWARYAGFEPTAAFHRDLMARIAGLTGVAAVGATTDLPLSGSGCAVLFTDDPAVQERLAECFATPVLATPGYFETMGIDVRGRAPTWLDMEARRGGVVVTEAFADRVWPGEDPIGKRIRGNGRTEPYYHVVGIAGDVRLDGLDEAPVPQVYFPMLPIEGANLWSPPTSMTIAVRMTGGEPSALAGTIRGVIRSMDPGIAVGAVRPMSEVVAASMQRTSFAMLLLGIAAVVALALGVIGLYGVVSYGVAQRRSEIGIRIALGADRRRVRGMVVREAAVLAGVGVAVGMIASLGVTRVLATQLYGVAARDPATLTVVGATLVTIALMAAWIPATSAARVDPMTVLRGE